MPIDKSKMVFIDIGDVPEPRRTSKWDEIFDSIMPGKALVISENDVSYPTIRTALKDRQKKGYYPDYTISSKGSKGSRMIYVGRKKA